MMSSTQMAGIQSSQLVFTHIVKKVKISEGWEDNGKTINLMWKNY